MRKGLAALVAGLWAGGMGLAAITPNDFREGTDSDRIEAAVAKAVETGERSVEIPRMNAKSGQPVWLIGRAILLPSDFTLVLRDCLVRLAPGTQDNLIRNAGTAKQPMEANENIRILGVGNAVLSGGLQAHFDPPGDKSGWRTIGVLLCGVRRFTIEGFAMEETQAWAVSVENGCCHGRIANLEFRNTNKYPNQDGVDIRKGCHDILIENITGQTGDDTVALTGLRNEKAKTNPGLRTMQVGGNMPRPDDDIYNITVRNVRAKVAGGHHIVRLLNQDGIKLYNIFISDVMDASGPNDPRVQAGVKIGDLRYWSMSQCQLGDTYNVFVDNVLTRGKTGVRIQGPLKNAVLRNIVGYGGCTNLAEKTAPTENVIIDAKSF
ncbi:MAG TPA: glycosyl hydrolase family 28 protein [Kiritimatiellia bacterium]|nr:glycosyl hydrolase family 28 protein [Kiritimatiellia bacterium]